MRVAISGQVGASRSDTSTNMLRCLLVLAQFCTSRPSKPGRRRSMNPMSTWRSRRMRSACEPFAASSVSIDESMRRRIEVREKRSDSMLSATNMRRFRGAGSVAAPAGRASSAAASTGGIPGAATPVGACSAADCDFFGLFIEHRLSSMKPLTPRL
jgi:hypothetical protein